MTSQSTSKERQIIASCDTVVSDDEIIERAANAMFAVQDTARKFRRAQSVKQRMSEYKADEMCAMASAALRVFRTFDRVQS